jgi:hypothetical protein
LGEYQKRRLEKLPGNKITGTPRSAAWPATPKRVWANWTLLSGLLPGVRR